MMVKCIINTFNKFHESFLLKIFEEKTNLKFISKKVLKSKIKIIGKMEVNIAPIIWRLS